MLPLFVSVPVIALLIFIVVHVIQLFRSLKIKPTLGETAVALLAGLSRLSVWWIRLGIRAQRIQAGHPEQNGRHERMHRTLKEATASPPEASRRAQQRAFDRFSQEYNEVRPHQGLGMRTPGSVYCGSSRPYPGRLPEPEYCTAMKVRRVFSHGQFFWEDHHVFLSKVLAGERIGLLSIDDRYQRIHLAWCPIARLDQQTMRVERLRPQDHADDARRLPLPGGSAAQP
jgi:hypothetical protein